MAQHGVSHATTSAETSSLLSVGAEARRPSKPQYVQTKKQPLGEGSFAKVYEAMNQETREIVAMKKVSWEKLEKQQPRYIQRHKTQLRNEIACLQALRHPNIVRLLHHVNTPKYFIMYLEFCAGGDLAGALRKRKGEVVDEGLARRLVEMLAEGLREMRKLNWVHRDLKPGNLLLTCESLEDATLKIGDFGFAKTLAPESLAETWVGSPLYMAPEILTKESGGYDAKADLWSVGCILFEMVNGRQPYGSTARDREELKADIRADRKFCPDPPICLSEHCHDLLARLLQRVPAQRLAYDEFFAHPWLGLQKSAAAAGAGSLAGSGGGGGQQRMSRPEASWRGKALGGAGGRCSVQSVNTLLSEIMAPGPDAVPDARAREPLEPRGAAPAAACGEGGGAAPGGRAGGGAGGDLLWALPWTAPPPGKEGERPWERRDEPAAGRARGEAAGGGEADAPLAAEGETLMRFGWGTVQPTAGWRAEAGVGAGASVGAGEGGTPGRGAAGRSAGPARGARAGGCGGLWGEEPYGAFGLQGHGALLAGADYDEGFEMLDDSGGAAGEGAQGEPVWVMDDVVATEARRHSASGGAAARRAAAGYGLAAIKRALPVEVVGELLDTECLVLDVIRCTRQLVELGNERLRGEGAPRPVGGAAAAGQPQPAQALALYLWSLRLLLAALAQLRELREGWARGGWAVPEQLLGDWRASLASYIADDHCKAKLAMRMGVRASQGTDYPWVTAAGEANQWAMDKPATPSAQCLAYLAAVRAAREAASNQILLSLGAEEAQGCFRRALLLLCALMLDLPATSSDRVPLLALASLLLPCVPSPPDPCSPSAPGQPAVALTEGLVGRCARGGRFWALSRKQHIRKL